MQVFGRLADSELAGRRGGTRRGSARLGRDQPATHAQLRTRVRAFAGRTPGDPLRLEDLAVHAIVLLLLGAVCANVATLTFARTAMRERRWSSATRWGRVAARVVAQIVTNRSCWPLPLPCSGSSWPARRPYAITAWVWGESDSSGTAAVLGGRDTGAWSPWRMALLLALVAAALIGLLPALRATGASVQRGLQGITSTGGTMTSSAASGRSSSADRWLLRCCSCPPRWVSSQLADNQVEMGSVSDGALPHLPPQDGQRGTGRRARCA